MKKLFILCISFAFLFLSCEEETNVPPKDPETANPVALALDDIKRNRQLLAKAWETLPGRLPADTIKHLRKISESRAQFVLEMVQRTKGLFKEVIKSNSDSKAADYYIKLPDIDGESRSMELSRLYAEEYPLEEFAARLTKAVKESKANKWGILESYASRDGNTLPIPQAEATVNEDQILAAIQIGEIVADPSMSEQEQETAIAELVAKANIPQLMNGLLLPAVQHYTDEPSNDPFMSWLNTEVNPAINGGLNRDIIRRVAAAGLVASIECLVNDQYTNDNQTTASWQLLEARFNTSLIFLWNEVWDQVPER
ncbi:hypothetical protein EDD80_1126 [Anseongella ginsenosidimutans]|uniref:Uncharacterized protein n=1 Tax=Anseongella ginsenosidimutans TaxID=496056 RepID=A0A4R3KMM5_9SPHI|nr:hypothetical protein [Anseongella ginsenosidimutans]QEC52686.1 hypothetical protein FRZ59_10270 [Anseongella ginsenosidimutans]TCS85434.1 hypothetical protein EDD80_1126 [Anseongella ginsenosidimutans]